MLVGGGRARARLETRRIVLSTTGPTGVEATGGTGEPGCDARGRWQGQGGLRDDAPSRRLAARTASGRAAAHGRTKQPGPRDRPRGARNTSGTTSNKTGRQGRQRDLPWCRRIRRARLRCPWAAAGPGQTTSHRAKPPISTPGPTGMKGAGETGEPGCGARGRRRGLAGLRDDAPSRRLAARTTSGRAAAHGHTEQPGPRMRKPRPADAGRGQPTQSGGRV